MTPRIRNPHALAPEAVKAMVALEQSLTHSGL
ncbi:MAG: carboxymuconolactone decarboxylase family protein, partial [Sphingomonas sp.]